MYNIFIPKMRMGIPFSSFKLILTMKIILALVFISVLQVTAKSVAQNISLTVKNAPLDEVFRLLRQQSQYNFLYDADVLESAKKVSLSVKNTPFREVLDYCFKDQTITFVIVNKNVVIKKAKAGENKISDNKKVSITGIVTDEKSVPLPGVSVLLKGTSTGVTTNADGRYTINVPGAGQILIFSFIGFQRQEIAVNDRVVLNIVLKEQSSALNEVVVIGYGTQRRKDVTGSVASIKAADLDVSTSSNFLQSMQGKASGIQVTQSTGQPGAGVDIKIRSNPSNADPGTLYVIDGVVVNNNTETPAAARYGTTGVNQSPLNFINPNDIENIEILKDASSRAIYGAQAGGGVVLITTKRGKSGVPSLLYTGSYAAQKADKMYEVLGTKDYMTQRNLINQEVYLYKNKVAPYYGTVDASSIPAFTPLYTQQEIDNTPIYQSAMDAIIRSGNTQQHNLSLSASTGKTTYFISGNYFDQTGVVLGTQYKRWNGKANLDQSLSDKIKIGINLIGSNGTSSNAVTGGRSENGGIITAAMYYPANLPLQAADGSYPLNPSWSNTPNPLSFSTITDQTENRRLLASAYGSWEIIKGLTARANFSYDQGSAKRNNFLPTTFSYGAQVNGIASVSNTEFKTRQIDYTVNYKLPLNNIHSLDFLAGYQYQLQSTAGVSAGNQNFTSNVISYYNLGAGQANRPVVASSQTQVIYASYFARTIYQFKNNYTLQASIRRDGSSRFAKNHKWGYFPAVSAGWTVSDEKFFEDSKIVDFLKVRVGYGEIGNANFPASAFEIYGLRSNPNFGINNTPTGIYLTQAANPDLKWETAGELNAGLDFAILNNRLSGSFDYFNKTIRDLISYIPFPADFTVAGLYGNAGTTKSTGYEISLQSKNVTSEKKSGFSWSTNINLSHYLSYWSKRSPQALAVLPRYQAASGKDALFRGIWGYNSIGLFTGNFGTGPSTMPDMLPGGLIIEDIHGYDSAGNLVGPDGRITNADQTLLGNFDPTLNIGFGNRFTFKNFDLNVFFSGVIQKAYSPFRGNYSAITGVPNSGGGMYRISVLDANMGTFGWNTMPISLQRWTYQNTEGRFPSGVSDPIYSSFQNSSSYFLVDASYLRCQNITLGYNIPRNILARQKTISNLRLSLDMQNVFVITKYPELDPQLDQSNFYPLSRGFVIGLNAAF